MCMTGVRGCHRKETHKDGKRKHDAIKWEPTGGPQAKKSRSEREASRERERKHKHKDKCDAADLLNQTLAVTAVSLDWNLTCLV